eukprot:581294-Alexandrium_andersonii.AAC.1
MTASPDAIVKEAREKAEAAGGAAGGSVEQTTYEQVVRVVLEALLGQVGPPKPEVSRGRSVEGRANRSSTQRQGSAS